MDESAVRVEHSVPWRIGDLVRIDHEGYYYHGQVGRIGRMDGSGSTPIRVDFLAGSCKWYEPEDLKPYCPFCGR